VSKVWWRQCHNLSCVPALARYRFALMTIDVPDLFTYKENRGHTPAHSCTYTQAYILHTLAHTHKHTHLCELIRSPGGKSQQLNIVLKDAAGRNHGIRSKHVTAEA
jgi:hypothetical protein